MDFLNVRIALQFALNALVFGISSPFALMNI